MELGEDDWLTHQQTRFWIWKQEMLWGPKGEAVGMVLFMVAMVTLTIALTPK